MRMPPLPTDFIFPQACKPICEKLLTLPEFLLEELDIIEPGGVGVMLIGDHDADLGIGLLGDDLAAGELPAGIGDGIGI